MGIINIDSYLKQIEEIPYLSEQEIADQMVEEAYLHNKEIEQGNYQSLVEYLRGTGHSSSIFAKYLCFLSYDKSTILFDKILNAFDIYDINRKEKLDYLIDSATETLTRISEWNYESIHAIRLTDGDVALRCYSATFIYQDKWNHATPEFMDKLIFDDDSNLVWMKNDYMNPQFYVQTGKTLYGLFYEHVKSGEKVLTIYNNQNILNLGIKEENISNATLDSITNKVNDRLINYNKVNIDISKYFDGQFFYKGPKWKYEYPPAEISVMKSIHAENGLLRIEIENVTYPHKGYFFLDIKDNLSCQSTAL